MSDPQISTVFHKNLNRHGYGFHYRVLHEVERLYNERKSYWRFEAAEFPVEVQGHGTRIDFVLSSNSKSIYLLAECKRADPALN